MYLYIIHYLMNNVSIKTIIKLNNNLFFKIKKKDK